MLLHSTWIALAQECADTNWTKLTMTCFGDTYTHHLTNSDRHYQTTIIMNNLITKIPLYGHTVEEHDYSITEAHKHSDAKNFTLLGYLPPTVQSDSAVVDREEGRGA